MHKSEYPHGVAIEQVEFINFEGVATLDDGGNGSQSRSLAPTRISRPVMRSTSQRVFEMQRSSWTGSRIKPDEDRERPVHVSVGGALPSDTRNYLGFVSSL